MNKELVEEIIKRYEDNLIVFNEDFYKCIKVKEYYFVSIKITKI